MNLGQIRRAVARRVGADLDPAAIDELINVAVHEIETTKDWLWYQTTAAIATVGGTQGYAVPANWKRTKRLYYADGSELVYVEPGVYHQLYFGNPMPTGRPQRWTYWGGSIQLGSVPDGVYAITHDYYKTEPDLVAESDSPLLPARYHPAIVVKVLLLAGEITNAPDARMNRASRAYAEWVQRMYREARPVTSASGPAIRA